MTSCPATVHDTMSARKYHGCACPTAAQATYRYEKQLRIEHRRGLPRTVDVTGSRRRLQALSAIGYSQPDLAARLNVTQQRVWQYLAGPRPKLRRVTAARIARLYADLADTPSTGPQATRTRNSAARHGWLPPIWWDEESIDDPTHLPPVADRARSRDDVDPIVVDRLIAGTLTGRPTRAERYHAYLRMRFGDWSDKAIVERLRLSWSTFAEYQRRADATSIEEAA